MKILHASNFQSLHVTFVLQRQEEIKVTSDGGIIPSSGRQGSGWSGEVRGPERIKGILSHVISRASLGAIHVEAMRFPQCCVGEETRVRTGSKQKTVLKPGTEGVCLFVSRC